MSYQVKKLTPELVEDYLYFFENTAFCDDSAFAGCYCTWYHWSEEYEQEMNAGAEEEKGNYKKALAEKLVLQGKLNGFLAYDGDTVVGWCNADDKQALSGISKEKAPDIWDEGEEDKALSIVCFVTAPDMRGKGVARELVLAATAYAENNTYNYVEAYPAMGEFSVMNSNGPAPMFEKCGFEIKETPKGAFIARKYFA